MTFYEQLEKHLSVKQHVLVQDDEGEYCVFSNILNGDWRRSKWETEKEYAMDYIGFAGVSKEEIKEYAAKENWKIIKAFDIPTGRFQVGDKVVVSEDIIEICKKYKMVHRADALRAMKGKACVVMNSWGDYGRLGSLVYFVILKDSKGVFSHVLPHEALSYPIETEENEQEATAAQEAIKLLEKNGYVISKK